MLDEAVEQQQPAETAAAETKSVHAIETMDMNMYIKQANCKSSIDDVCSPPRPEQKRFHRHSSSNTVISNASSMRSHRRSYVEVGSMMFGGPPTSVQAPIPMCRQMSEPIKRSSSIHRSSYSEHRAPDEDSKASTGARVLVSKDSETICCTASKDDDDETERVFDLIKKLSFETGDVGSDVKKSTVSVCSAPTVLIPPTFLAARVPRRSNLHQQDHEDFRPVSPPLQLPLPPKIHRMEDSHSVVSLPDHVPQIMHNRNRLRSTSLSEMSDSCRLVFDNHNYDQADACSLNSFGSYSSKSEKVILNTIENGLSPPLHPATLPRAPPLLNRGRTSTMTSDHSSFLSSSSSSSDESSDEHSISSYEDELRGLDDPPGFYDGDFKSEPGLKSFARGCGRTYMSWDHNIPTGLSSEVLQEWDKFCEDEELYEGIATKHQHILRALSCPDIRALHDVDFKVQEQTDTDAKSVDEEEPVSPPEVVPHLLANDLPMSQAPSRSIFSYTNSYSPSTISSGLSDHLDEISHLDFDMSILYPREIEVINSPNTTDTVALQRKRLHRRSRSSMGLSKPLHAKKHLTTHRRHRRNKSENILDQVDSDAAPKKHHRMLSITDIIEDVKSLSSSGAKSSDMNLLNVLSLSLGSDELNACTMKESIAKVWTSHREKICWFTIGCCFATSVQYFLQL
jgi:hypothetical protein